MKHLALVLALSAQRKDPKTFTDFPEELAEKVIQCGQENGQEVYALTQADCDAWVEKRTNNKEKKHETNR